PRAVRVAGLREVGPVRGHELRHLPVLRPPGKVPRGEHAEDELDLAGMRRPGLVSGLRIARQWQRLVEFVAVHRRSARPPVRLDPLPRPIGYEGVALVVLRTPP